MKVLVQAADHGKREWSVSSQYFVDPGPGPDYSNEGFMICAFLFKPKVDRFDWVGEVHWEMGFFERLDKRSEDFEAVSFGSSFLGGPQSLDLE